MTLLLIIPVAWLVVGAIVVMLCRGAKQGDAIIEEGIGPARRSAALSGVVILADGAPLLTADPRHTAQEPQPSEPSGEDDAPLVRPGAGVLARHHSRPPAAHA